MKKLDHLLFAALATLLTLPAFAAEAETTKADAIQAPSAPLVKYEIKIDRKILKDAESLLAKIEESETFKGSECSLETKKKGVFTYSCLKVTCKTDEIFRGLVQPGLRLLALSTTCPLGCKWATSCSPSGVVACCRIVVPTQKCPGTF